MESCYATTWFQVIEPFLCKLAVHYLGKKITLKRRSLRCCYRRVRSVSLSGLTSRTRLMDRRASPAVMCCVHMHACGRSIDHVSMRMCFRCWQTITLQTWERGLSERKSSPNKGGASKRTTPAGRRSQHRPEKHMISLMPMTRNRTEIDSRRRKEPTSINF
jgi:hypothetical protein